MLDQMQTDALIAEWKGRIDAMTHEDIARLWRFAPPGHPVFDTAYRGLYEYFMGKFFHLGGMTTEVGKAVGF